MTAHFRKSVYLTLVLVFAMFLVGCDALVADTEDTIKRSFDVKEGGTLYIDTDRGSIEITADKGNTVSVEVNRIARTSSKSRAEELFRNFDLSCLDKMVRISDLLFSPDGQFLFFSTARVNVEANRRDKAFF